MPKGVYKRKKRRDLPVATYADLFSPDVPDVEPAITGAMEQFERNTREFWAQFGIEQAQALRRAVMGDGA